MGYTARQLQDAIHSPIRGTQLGGPTGDLLTRVQQGGYAEHLGIVGELFQSSDLDKIFTQPKYVAMILDNVPVFKAVTGVEEIAAKGEDMTPQDVSVCHFPFSPPFLSPYCAFLPPFL
jgi:hypothetical protein